MSRVKSGSVFRFGCNNMDIVQHILFYWFYAFIIAIIMYCVGD